jgi:hypothetical protein
VYSGIWDNELPEQHKQFEVACALLKLSDDISFYSRHITMITNSCLIKPLRNREGWIVEWQSIIDHEITSLRLYIFGISLVYSYLRTTIWNVEYEEFRYHVNLLMQAKLIWLRNWEFFPEIVVEAGMVELLLVNGATQ